MVQEISKCSYDQLEQKLHVMGAESGAAEAHGLLCGTICAGGKAVPAVWLEYLLGENTLSATAQDSSDMLTALQSDIVRQFHDDALGFVLLLPADTAPLAQRTDELGHWCAGFLYGLALGGIREGAGLPDTVSEVMQDWYFFSYMETRYFNKEEHKKAIASELYTEQLFIDILEEEVALLQNFHQNIS